MGTGYIGGTPKSEIIENEIAEFTSFLPVAELLNGGLIRVSGISGYFNPNSLLEPSWLKGKMTIDEYRSAINYINSCALRTQLESKNRLYTKETHEREMAKIEAGRAAVQKINEKHKSVHFTYQPSIEKVDYIPIYNLNLMSFITVLRDVNGCMSVRCYLYINLN